MYSDLPEELWIGPCGKKTENKRAEREGTDGTWTVWILCGKNIQRWNLFPPDTRKKDCRKWKKKVDGGYIGHDPPMRRKRRISENPSGSQYLAGGSLWDAYRAGRMQNCSRKPETGGSPLLRYRKKETKAKRKRKQGINRTADQGNESRTDRKGKRVCKEKFWPYRIWELGRKLGSDRQHGSCLLYRERDDR